MKGENSDRVPLLLPLSLTLLIFLPLSSPSVFTSASTRHRLLLALAYLTLLLTLPCSFTLLQNVYSELKTFKTSTGIWVIDIFYSFLYLWSVATSSHPQKYNSPSQSIVDGWSRWLIPLSPYQSARDLPRVNGGRECCKLIRWSAFYSQNLTSSYLSGNWHFRFDTFEYLQLEEFLRRRPTSSPHSIKPRS